MKDFASFIKFIKGHLDGGQKAGIVLILVLSLLSGISASAAPKILASIV
ncbi:hypothetical protein [uncultured Desulfobacter sp.]|nr:hypothetical protein [uncultured Desulfobacter sp.]